MHYATLLLAVLPSLAAAAGKLGFALGAKNADGSCKTTNDYIEDFKVLAPHSTIVRVYAAGQCNTAAAILPAAKKDGVQVVLGIWPDVEESFQADKAAIVKYAPQYAEQVYAITVGSESLYRGNFTGKDLMAKIQDVKTATGGKFKVGTADSWNKYQDGTADPLINGGVDILLCNAFSYWQGQAIKNATASFMDDIGQAFGHIQARNKKIELWVGETGWPTAGNDYKAAVPTLENAKTYWETATCAAVNWGYNVFAFEAFDEPWKPKSIGQDGIEADETHWGVWNADRSAKWDVSC